LPRAIDPEDETSFEKMVRAELYKQQAEAEEERLGSTGKFEYPLTESGRIKSGLSFTHKVGKHSEQPRRQKRNSVVTLTKSVAEILQEEEAEE
jgi:hypothetical protein